LIVAREVSSDSWVANVDVTEDTEGWTKLEGEFTFTEEDSAIYFETQSGVANFFIDDVSVEKLPSEAEDVPEPSTGNIVAN
ncbi:hypothetical protein, partial [Pseudomonas sp. 2995-3]|uniref:hypothetical protein n=1 Tax=Pseudomonas sp. 2995-3 TaxID=1712680 RepID=UPI0013041C1B